MKSGEGRQGSSSWNRWHWRSSWKKTHCRRTRMLIAWWTLSLCQGQKWVFLGTWRHLCSITRFLIDYGLEASVPFDINVVGNVDKLLNKLRKTRPSVVLYNLIGIEKKNMSSQLRKSPMSSMNTWRTQGSSLLHWTLWVRQSSQRILRSS